MLVHEPVHTPATILPVVGCRSVVSHLDGEAPGTPQGKPVPFKVTTRYPQARELTIILQTSRHVCSHLVLLIQLGLEIGIETEMWVGIGLYDSIVHRVPRARLAGNTLDSEHGVLVPLLAGH